MTEDDIIDAVYEIFESRGHYLTEEDMKADIRELCEESDFDYNEIMEKVMEIYENSHDDDRSDFSDPDDPFSDL